MVKVWGDLSPYEHCVITNASSGDGSGPPWILSSWDPWWQPGDLARHSGELAAAIGTLMEAGLVSVTDGMTLDAPLMTIEEVAVATADPQNWFYGEEGLNKVLWVTTTEAGDHLLTTTAPRDEAMRYFDPRRHLKPPA